MPIRFDNLSLQRISAQVNRPLQNRDNPVDIHPSFPFMLAIEGVIHNVHDTAGIAVQITFPHEVVRHYYPPPDHFTCVDDQDASAEDSGMAHESDEFIGEANAPGSDPLAAGATGTFRLRTSIEIYPEAAWGTTPTGLRIAISRSFQPDLTGHDEFICRFAEEMMSERRQGHAMDASQFTEIQPAELLLSQSSPWLRQAESGSHGMSHDRGSSSSSSHQSGQSTLEVSRAITHYVSRRALFAGL
jgi:hypothetical protein